MTPSASQKLFQFFARKVRRVGVGALAPRPGAAAARSRRSPRNLLSLLILGASAAGCTSAGAQLTDDLFEQYEVVTGNAHRQTVLTGFFLGQEVADLAVLSTSESSDDAETDDRRLRIYAYADGAWVQRVDEPLRPEVLFVDVANIEGRDRLITYEPGLLNWFDPDTATEQVLADVAVSYNAAPSGLHYAALEPTGPADEGEVPHVDITRDLNRDGRDDLIFPDIEGFWVLIQMRDGSFEGPVKLGPAEPFRDQVAMGDKRSYGRVGISPLTIPWYLSRVHQMDYDQDGRSDLVFWNEDHFDLHRQDARGLFSPVAETFSVDVPFDADGAYSLIFAFSDASTFSLVTGLRKKTRQTVLQSVRDLNNDGTADLVVHSLEGRSLLRQRSRYEVHWGTPTGDGIVFARDVSTVVEPRGRAGGMGLGGYSSVWLEDFDGNGQLDIMRGDIKIGLFAVIRALLGTSISMGAELYGMNDGAYPVKATTRRKIKADLDVRGGGRDAGFFPAVLVGDVTGDGCTDVLVGKSRKELRVFLGGPELLAARPQKVAVTLPGDERNSWLVDLNRDGKQDVLMHFPSASSPHRVTMLISR